MKKNRIKKIGLDIFSGAGGLSKGAEMAGINVKFAIEVNKYAAETYTRNHPHSKMFCGDICALDPHDVVESTPVFIIMGGPPCQGYSLSNTRTRNMDNPKNLLFREFVRFVKVINPEWFLFENVWGLTSMNEGKVKDYIEELFRELGYKVSSKVLWASHFGVPQNRHRFFMVGNRNGINFEFPNESDVRISVEDAIGDLPVLKNGDMYDSLPYRLPFEKASSYAQSMRSNSTNSKQNYVSRNNDLVIERYTHIQQGENWRAIPDNLMQNYADKSRCHSGIYKRLIADQPSVVISNYRKSMLIHPFQHRGLSVREAARIQSFPDDFIFEGSIMYKQQQIGNAVPPLLAKAVVKQILSYSL
jgi:DNA (cytosine-5)-methyltransferase 1